VAASLATSLVVGASFATVVGDSFAIFLTRSFTRILRMAINSTHAMCGVVGWRNLIANGRGLYGVSTGYARRVCFLMGGSFGTQPEGRWGATMLRLPNCS
jgi:hypothetical protein